MTISDARKTAAEAYRDGNYKDSLPDLSALADQGNVEASLATAWIYETGAAGKKDIENAVRYYCQAADLGSCDALYRLGRIYRKSNNLDAAITAFERGAVQEYLPCASALGMLLLKFTDDPDKINDGIKWIKYSSDRGHIFARKELILLELKETNSIVFVLKSLAKLCIIRIQYLILKMTNRYSTKIL